MEPITRYEQFLAFLANGSGTPPTPVTRVEVFLNAIINGTTPPDPITRFECFLASIGGKGEAPEPILRVELYLAAVAGAIDVESLPEPVTREEHWLYDWAVTGTFPESIGIKRHTLTVADSHEGVWDVQGTKLVVEEGTPPSDLSFEDTMLIVE